MMSFQIAAEPTSGFFYKSEESIDIRDSLDRIEKLLDRGQQLLYGDEITDDKQTDGEAAAFTSAYGVEDAVDTESTLQHVHVNDKRYQSSPKSGQSPSHYGGTVDESVVPRPLGTAANVSFQLPGVGANTGASSCFSPKRTLQHSMSRSHASTDLRSVPSMRPASRPKKLSITLRGQQIAQIQKEGGMVPSLEEGIDASDTAQSITLAELKERIRRELDEYRRFGPLMHRLDSQKRQQRAAAAAAAFKRAATATSTSRPSFATRTTSPEALANRTVKRGPARGSKKTPHQSPERRTLATSYRAQAPGANTAARSRGGTQSAPASQKLVKSAIVTPATTNNLSSTHQRRPYWERLYPSAAVQSGKRNQGTDEPRMGGEEREPAKKKLRTSVFSPPSVHSKHSATYQPLRTSELRRKAWGQPSMKQTSGSNYTSPQSAAHTRQRQPTSSSVRVPSNSFSMTDQPANREKALLRAAAPRPLAPTNRAQDTKTKLSSTPSPLSPMPKDPEQQIHRDANYVGNPVEFSSFDEEGEPNASQPFIARLDLTKVKK